MDRALAVPLDRPTTRALAAAAEAAGMPTPDAAAALLAMLFADASRRDSLVDRLLAYRDLPAAEAACGG